MPGIEHITVIRKTMSIPWSGGYVFKQHTVGLKYVHLLSC